MFDFIYDLLILLPIPLYRVSLIVLKVFFALADVKAIDSDNIRRLITNIYVVIGIVMLFAIAFSLLKSMVSEADEKKTTSSTVKKTLTNIITSTLIIILLPSIFTFAMDFQKAIIVDYNVIGRVFGFGKSNNSTDNGYIRTTDVQYAANMMVNSVYTAFFNVKTCDDTNGDCSYKFSTECKYNKDTELNEEWYSKCQNSIKSSLNGPTFLQVLSQVDETGNLELYAGFGDKWADKLMKYDFLLCIVCGFILIYVIASFAIDMGIRFVKLIFYQLIAPIPVFLRVVPNDKFSGTFKNWVKATITCYAEVFIRLIIVYFVIYMSTLFTEEKLLSVGFPGGLFGAAEWLICKALLFVGLFTFMKQAPKLLSEVTGIDSSNIKLGIKDKLAQGGLYAAGATVGSLATAGVRNAVNAGKNLKNNWQGATKKERAGLVAKTIGSTLGGVIGGGVRGYSAGKNAKSFKDMKTAASTGATKTIDARNKRANYKAAHGGTTSGVISGHFKDLETSLKNYANDESIEGLTREKNNMNKLATNYKTFESTLEQLLESEQKKGKKSVFHTGFLEDGVTMQDNGFGFIQKQYDDFDIAEQNLREMRSKFERGKASVDDVRKAESTYIKSRDAVRDALMNVSLEGEKGANYQLLNAKGQAALKDSLVNAETMQATILENASSKVVQEIMGKSGNNSLQDIIDKKPITVKAFEFNGSKLKDTAKVAQGQAEIKIAEMNKEQAAKGDKKS